MHRAWIAPSQLKTLLRARPGNTIPSISPMCAQARRPFTQVIHMVVHSKRVRRSLARLAGGAGQRAGACVRRPARRMPDLAWAWMTSPKKAGTGCSPHTPWHAQAARAQSPPTPVPPPALPQPRVEARGAVPIGDRVQQPVTGQQRPMPGRWPGGVSLLFSYPDQRGPAASRSAAPTRARAQEAGRKILDHHSQPCLGPSHYCTAPSEIPGRPIRDLRPSGPAGQTLLARRRGTRSCGLALRRSCTGLLPARRLPRSLPPVAARRPGNLALLGRTPDHRGRHSRGCRGAGPAKTFLPGRIRHGPSMYEMEGPCPASPRRLASCLVFAARRAPPAGARYPREGPVSRLLPRSRRRPRVVPVSSGESISTTAPSTAQGPAASHFLFFRYPRRNPQKAGSYPHFTAVIHGFTHSLPTGYGCKPENT